MEITTILGRYGATGFMFGWEGHQAVVAFRAHDRNVRFMLALPTIEDEQFLRNGRGVWRDAKARQTAHEAEIRRCWRALTLAIKAKLEVVATGISTFEDEFLAHIVLPDGTTVGERVRPEIARAVESGAAPRQLLALPAGGSQ
jgi:hypothetical protein